MADVSCPVTITDKQEWSNVEKKHGVTLTNNTCEKKYDDDLYTLDGVSQLQW